MTGFQASPAPPRGTLTRVRLGMIGFGMRGQALARALPAIPGAELAAVSDAYEGRLVRSREIAGDKVSTARDPSSVIDRGDIDAVVLATPDHLHVPLAVRAASAGKHVYCETPVLHQAADASRLSEAFAAGRVLFAGGSGASTSPLLLAAREMIASGRIGKPVLIRATWDSAGAFDAWQVPFPPDASPATVDFASFDRDGAASAFDSKRFFRWRCYWRYGSGLAGARVAPIVSIAQALTGVTQPSRVTASGSTRRWKDGREVPDVLAAAIEYDEPGLSLHVATSLAAAVDRRDLTIVGTEGALRIEGDELLLTPEAQTEPYAELGETWPKEYRDWFYMMHGMTPQAEVRGTPPIEPAGERFSMPASNGANASALADFVEAIRSGRPPRERLADAVAASQTASVVADAAREGRVWTREG